MVTTFNTKDLTSFGLYLLSAERRERFKQHPNFGEERLEERLSEVHHSDIENWKDSLSKVHKVRAKFICNNVDKISDNSDTCNVQMDVVIEGSPENKQFSEYTPYWQFNLGIDKNAPALELFEEGREYYFDIIKAPIET